MAFALVDFYQEEVWDVILSSDIILDDKDKVKDNIEGLKTLVHWRDVKSKAKGKSTKVPAKVIKISDDKDCLLWLMKGENESPVSKGKGCRKRILNSKYVEESDADEEQATGKVKRSRTLSTKNEDAKRSASLVKLIKEKYNKECQQNYPCDNGSDSEEMNYKKSIETLEIKIKGLQQENARLREQIASSDDLKNSVKKLKRYITRLEDAPSISSVGSSSPALSSVSFGSMYSSEQSPVASQSPGSTESIQTQVMQPLPTKPEYPLTLANHQVGIVNNQKCTTDMIVLGPGLSILQTIFKRMKPRKVGSYVANIMGATLSREHMATHSYKGQKGKNGQMKPKLDALYTKSLIEHGKNIKYTDMPRPVIEEDIIKAIKFKLNNEEQAWKKTARGPWKGNRKC